MADDGDDKTIVEGACVLNVDKQCSCSLSTVNHTICMNQRHLSITLFPISPVVNMSYLILNENFLIETSTIKEKVR